MTMQQYCLRWNNHQPNFISVFSSLLNSESLVDVTLAAEGRHLQAHKVVLSACSSYFQSLFTINPCQHPIVILKDVKFMDLKVIIDFMYYGEVNVSQDQLPYILKTAEMLKIKGLAEIPVDQSVSSKIECSMDRAEVLTQADNSWTADNQHSTSIGTRQSLSPSPRPLSPFSKRKRLRKTSSGSGSGSADKIPEEMPLSADGTLTSGIGSLSSVIKSESGSFQSECNLSLKTLKSSTDSESHNRSSSQESIEEKHITLQIPQHQQELTSHIEQQSSNTLDVVGPSTSSNVPQHTVTGIQWNVMDQIGYAHYTTSPTTLQTNTISHCVLATVPQETNTTSPTPNNPNSNNTTFPTQIINSPPQIHKRKRSINPQNEENFIRALEAVRYGGIGFCKAARMYGVNNRTLWLEYKKRGYPNFRLSIKKQNKKEGEPAQAQSQEPEPQQSSEATRPIIIEEVQTNPIALVNDGFYDNKHIDFGPILHRTKYLDAAIVNAQALNFQTINFEQI